MENRLPKLRFPEFSGEWEEKKLKDVFSIFNGYAFASKSSETDGVLWVKIADVGIQEMKYNNLSFLPLSFSDKHKKFILKKGDYVVALTRPILNGKLKIAQINDFFNGALLNQRVGRIDSQNCHPFVYSLLQRDELIKSIENNIAGSDPPNLSPHEINSISLKIPSLIEQTKIANFLTEVDKKLTALKQKKSLLEQYKKGVMQQIFSQELRFKDDNGNDFTDWEEKMLGEISKFSKGKNISKSDISDDGLYECIRYGQLYTHYSETIKDIISKTSLPPKNLVFSKYNDIIIPASGETQLDIATASCVLKDDVALGGDLNIIRTDNNGVYLSYYLNFYKKQDIANLSQGISVVHLYAKQLATLQISIPTLPEQTKIANFLSAIDEKIKHCKGQIEKTQVWKKGLLQQMFV